MLCRGLRLRCAAGKRIKRTVTPEDRAAALLAGHNPGGAIPVPVEVIARALNIEIVRKRHDGPESSFALRDGTKLMLGLNNNTSSRRQRVAVAHALGHLLLHDRPIIVCNAVRLTRDLPSVGSIQEEAQANAFAIELLMPREAVLAEFAGRSDGSEEPFPRDEAVAEMAKRFDVGSEFMCCRLVNLGLLAS
jgi:Zn-dependent peptidase ImmA (M78 family)